MNYIGSVFLALCLFTVSLQAENAPITIGIMHVNPPFASQIGKSEVFGFDIDMMNSLCKIMKRNCTYKFILLKNLIPYVAEGKVDVSVSSITINAERAKQINFSLPYMVSYTRFLARRTSNPTPFSLEALSGKTIGIKTGDIFKNQIQSWGIQNIGTKEYKNTPDQLEALNSGAVDYVMLDDPVAHYWSTSYSRQFMLVGPAYPYGDGFAIAVNPKDPQLLADIDNALKIYQNSDDYKNSYNKYISQFEQHSIK